MNRLLTFLLLCSVTVATSQALVLDSTHFFQTNKFYQREYVHDFIDGQSHVKLLDQKGANQLWDFSNMDIVNDEFYETLPTSCTSNEEAAWADNVPEADMRLRVDMRSDIFHSGQIQYFKKEGSIIQQIGQSKTYTEFNEGELQYFENPRNYFYQGMTFGDVHIDTFSIGALRMAIDTLVADAYGSIVLSDGDTIQNILRVKRKTYNYHIDYPENGQHDFAIYWYADGYETPLYLYESSEIGFGIPFFQRFEFKPNISYLVKYCVNSVKDERIENFYHQIYNPRYLETLSYQSPNYFSNDDCPYLNYRSLSKKRKIQLYKHDYPLNGVTTFDVVKINRHIIGIESFEHPWQYIAADVNQSGTITVMDMIIIRQLLLQKISEFPNGESWKFLPVDYEFPNTENPLAAPLAPAFSIPNAIFEGATYEFLGIKIGDVNGSADPNQ